MPIESQETMAGLPSEAATQVAKVSRPHRSRTRQPIIVGGAILLIASFAFWIYSGINSRVDAEKGLEKTVKLTSATVVNVVHPTSGSDAQAIELPGNTQAFTDAPIYARTSGYLKQWYFDIGARVKRGQLLAEIETPELDEQLEQAENQVKTAEANLQLAQVTADRWVYLEKSSVVSKQERDQAVSDLNAKRATADSAKANVGRLQKLQEFEHVYAPFDGVITVRNTDVGDLIQGDNTTPKELFHLAAVGKLRVYISVPEVYATAIKSGETVTLTLDAFPGEKFTGTLVRDSNSIDLTSRTLRVEVDVDNPSGRLLPGAYAFVHFKLPSAAGAVTVPTNTLLFRSEGLRVANVHDGQVKLVPVTIGHDYGSTVEVLSGLKPEDSVILDPSDSILDGSPVKIAEAAKAEGK
ncbi:MAG TPA: efflux RND transporter periplasmic adaptor subunit [Chthoniobacterales bacterium]|nr:efflux RND transporter periplasmic adaptor subunit [Chthoniobacterales bacterium]